MEPFQVDISPPPSFEIAYSVFAFASSSYLYNSYISKFHLELLLLDEQYIEGCNDTATGNIQTKALPYSTGLPCYTHETSISPCINLWSKGPSKGGATND